LTPQPRDLPKLTAAGRDGLPGLFGAQQVVFSVQGLKTLFEWYNLIYTLPFGLSVLLMIVSAMGLGGHDHGFLPTPTTTST